MSGASDLTQYIVRLHFDSLQWILLFATKTISTSGHSHKQSHVTRASVSVKSR